MSLTVQQQCTANSWCVPLYVYGALVVLGMTGTTLLARQKTLASRLSGLAKQAVWAVLYGALIWLLCRYHCRAAGWLGSDLTSATLPYMALLPPTLWFGMRMFGLVVRDRFLPVVAT